VLVDFPDIYAMNAPRALQCQNGRLEPASQFNIIMARYAFEQILPAYLDFNQPENLQLDIHNGAMWSMSPTSSNSSPGT
jgi:hypothetical protein